MFSNEREGAGSVEVFWGEIAPNEHLVQIYSDDDIFFDALEGYASGGMKAGDAVLIIATPDHIATLDARLAAQGFDLDALRASDSYIALDASATLASFMVRGWPDDERFETAIRAILVRARKSGRRVRAFGEMVAILWARGYAGATVRLEHLWNRLIREEQFSLFCAYPQSGFTASSRVSFEQICAAHTKVVGA